MAKVVTGEVQKAIINELRTGGDMTGREISKAIGKDHTTNRNNINRMVSVGYIFAVPDTYPRKYSIKGTVSTMTKRETADSQRVMEIYSHLMRGHSTNPMISALIEWVKTSGVTMETLQKDHIKDIVALLDDMSTAFKLIEPFKQTNTKD